MIDYDFSKFKNQLDFLPDPFNNIYRDICEDIKSIIRPSNQQKSNDGTDPLNIIWKQLETHLSGTLNSDELQRILPLLRSDIFMSVYASLYYSTCEPIEFEKIRDLLKPMDPAMENEQTYDNELTRLKAQSSSFSKIIADKHLFGIYSQYIDSTTMFYFRSFSECTSSSSDKDKKAPQSSNFKCFNLYDYNEYMKNRALWPYAPNNISGMSFYNYFKLIHTMTSAFKISSKGDSFSLNFSCYILEELFHPVSFIQNARLCLLATKTASEESTESKTAITYPDEQYGLFLSLMYPLFKLPPKLWEKVAPDYCKHLVDYVEHRRYNPNAYYYLFADIHTMEYYTLFLIPCIKIIFANCLMLYTENNSKQQALDLLANHIRNDNITFNYNQVLSDHLSCIGKMNYLTTSQIPVDNYANGNIKKKGNDQKRNAPKVKTFEESFTHIFFTQKPIPEYFDHCNCTFTINKTGYSEYILLKTQSILDEAMTYRYGNNTHTFSVR
jgi:hypothetical protein